MPAPSPAGRAGTYRRQPGGYRAFIPARLPPDPPVRLEGRLQAMLSKADLALGRLAGSIETLPNPDLFVLMYVRKEAVLSSQIEGTQSSLQDLLAAEARVFDPEQPRDVAEVLNYVRRDEPRPGAARHAACFRAADPGNPREAARAGAWVSSDTRRTAQQPELDRPGRLHAERGEFVPPPPGEVPEALGALESFLHTDNTLPLLIEIGLAHAQFETIHPFLDGNGRVGRLLITFLLCEKHVLDKPVLYLSHYFKRHRQNYYDHLQAVRDKGAFEDWLEFFLTGVLEVSLEASDDGTTHPCIARATS